MIKIKPGKISTIVLWCSMLISLCIFVFFLWKGIKKPEENISDEAGILLNWVYVLFGMVIAATFFFTSKHIIDIFLRRPKSAFKRLVPFGLFALLLLLTYLLGSGQILNIPQYAGSENVYIWLKVADMWLYSIYFLLGITIVAVILGILWSYLKK